MPGTKPLTMTGDIASELVAGADRFLLKQIEESAAKRESHWKRDFSSPAAYQASVEPNRKRLAHILGVRDPRVCVRKTQVPAPLWWTTSGGPTFIAGYLDSLGKLVGIRRCDWRRSRADAEAGKSAAKALVNRDPGRRPDARAARRSGRGCSTGVAGARAGSPRTAIT